VKLYNTQTIENLTPKGLKSKIIQGLYGFEQENGVGLPGLLLLVYAKTEAH